MKLARKQKLLIEVFSLVAVSLLTVACTDYFIRTTASAIELYYFFSPDCPNCKAVQPFMVEIEKELEDKNVRVINLNVKEHDAWNPLYKLLAEKIVKTIQTDFIPIPTAVVRRSGRFYTLIGKESVLELNDYLHLWARTKRVNAKLDNQTFAIEDCISCHKARSIPLPSTYNCTFCCHRANKKA